MHEAARNLLTGIEEALAHDLASIDRLLTEGKDFSPMQARGLVAARDAIGTTREILLDTLVRLTETPGVL